MNTCAQCKSQFEITDQDRAFYRKIDVPEPKLCPSCRMQRRRSLRNEHTLYSRPCDLCKKNTISMYAPGGQKRVYCQECWWSDKWDGKEYGRAIDFSRPFFEQFQALFQEVPRIALINKEHTNSEYCNFAMRNKNSYLLLTCAECEDSFYSNRSWKSRNICDCSSVLNSELCYEVIDSQNCYNCTWLQNSSDCSECTLGYNLQGCSNCFGCVNLRKADFCIFNVKYAEEEYKKRIVELKKDFSAAQEQFEKLKQQSPRRYSDAINCQDSTGDALYRCKNAQICFRVKNIEDSKYVYDATNLKDVYDVNNDDNSELEYQMIGGETNRFVRFCDICWFNQDITYCSLSFHSNDLFGCVGLKKASFCILNKSYSEDEYRSLIGKLIAYMKEIGEWGQFFSPIISPFGYNETVAMDYHPLSKAEANAQKFHWQDAMPNVAGRQTITQTPQDIATVPDTIVKEIFSCAICGKNYKIILQELQFYRTMQLPLPTHCPNCRHLGRLRKRNPEVLHHRQCVCNMANHGHHVDGAQCANQFETTYAPDRPEKVFCEQCYQKEVV